MAILLQLFQRLVGRGHSIVVIEHNLEVIKCADWIIDLGPEAGDDGGEVVATGTPEQIARDGEITYRKLLRKVLGFAKRWHPCHPERTRGTSHCFKRVREVLRLRSG